MTIYFSVFVIKLALILLLSILPSLVYLLTFRKAKERWQSRLRRTQVLTTYYRSESTHRDSYVSYRHQNTYSGIDRRRPVTKYFIGDTSCINNAQSPYIRCAVNPEGPCDRCSHYEPKHDRPNS